MQYEAHLGIRVDRIEQQRRVVEQIEAVGPVAENRECRFVCGTPSLMGVPLPAFAQVAPSAMTAAMIAKMALGLDTILFISHLLVAVGIGADYEQELLTCNFSGIKNS